MASLLHSERALDDLGRLAAFLARDDPGTAESTGALIVQALEILASHPLIGRGMGSGLRELVISRGNTGYIALYTYHEARDRMIVHAMRHQREAGFEA